MTHTLFRNSWSSVPKLRSMPTIICIHLLGKLLLSITPRARPAPRVPPLRKRTPVNWRRKGSCAGHTHNVTGHVTANLSFPGIHTDAKFYLPSQPQDSLAGSSNRLRGEELRGQRVSSRRRCQRVSSWFEFIALHSVHFCVVPVA